MKDYIRISEFNSAAVPLASSGKLQIKKQRKMRSQINPNPENKNNKHWLKDNKLFRLLLNLGIALAIMHTLAFIYKATAKLINSSKELANAIAK